MDDLRTPASGTPVLNRVKRAQGQLAGVLRMIEEGRDLDDVLNQLKAVSKALDRAGFALVTQDLRRTLASGDPLDDKTLDTYEKHFLSLA